MFSVVGDNQIVGNMLNLSLKKWERVLLFEPMIV